MKGKRYLAIVLAAVMLIAQPVYDNGLQAYAKDAAEENKEDSSQETALTLYFDETNWDLLPMSKEIFEQGVSIEYTNPDICEMATPSFVEHEGEYLWCRFEVKQEGETDILIYVGDHQLYHTYHMTVKYHEQNVYLSLPTEIVSSQSDIRIEVDDPTICSAEILGNPLNVSWPQNVVRLVGLQKGTTYVRGYTSWNSLEFAKKVTVTDAPNNLVSFEDDNLRMALLGIGASGFSADSDKDGYISEQELQNYSYIPLQNCNIKSIQGLECAQNLTWLFLDGNEELSDISPLFELDNLRDVYIRNTSVSNEDQARLRQFPEEMSMNKGNRTEIPMKVRVYGNSMPSMQLVSGTEVVDFELATISLLAKNAGEAVIRVSQGDFKQDIKIHVNGIDADQPLGELSDRELTKADGSSLLDSSSRLWQTYPEVKLEKEKVTQYVSGYVYTKAGGQSNRTKYAYAIDEDGNLWSGEEKKAEHIVAAQGRYALTKDDVLHDIYSKEPADVENVSKWMEDCMFSWEENTSRGVTYILKKDGTLWYRWEGEKDEVPGELIQISDKVTDMANTEDGFCFLRENGEYCEFGFDWSEKDYRVIVHKENIVDLPDDGIYHSSKGETFVWDNYQQNYINVGKKDVTKVVNVSPWNPEGYYDQHKTYCLLSNGDVYSYIDGQEEQKILSDVKDLLHAPGENQRGTQCLYMGEDGIYRMIDGTAGTPESPLNVSELFGLYGYDYVINDYGIAADFNLSRNGILLLTHVKNAFETWDKNTEKTFIYITRTDGTVWRVEENGIPEKVLDLNENTNSSEMTEDQKQETVEQITAAEDKGTVSVDMESAVVLPKDVLEVAKEKEVTLECTLSDGTIWEIEGSTLASMESEKLADLDLSVVRAGKEDGAISSDKMEEIAGKRVAEQLNFADGGSGISAALTLKATSSTEGKTNMKCVAIGVNTQKEELLGVSLIVDQKMKLALSKVADCALVYAVNGDTSGDGKVNITDLMQTLHHVSGRSEFGALNQGIADVDVSGNTNITDLMRVLHFVSGRTETL